MRLAAWRVAILRSTYDYVCKDESTFLILHTSYGEGAVVQGGGSKPTRSTGKLRPGIFDAHVLTQSAIFS